MLTEEQKKAALSKLGKEQITDPEELDYIQDELTRRGRVHRQILESRIWNYVREGAERREDIWDRIDAQLEAITDELPLEASSVIKQLATLQSLIAEARGYATGESRQEE